MDLTLSYALYLVGREDADEIFDHSTKFFSYFAETMHSAAQFGHNYFYASQHYDEYLCRKEDDPDYDADNVLSEYFTSLLDRLNELRCSGIRMEFEEAICHGFRFRRWVYES